MTELVVSNRSQYTSRKISYLVISVLLIVSYFLLRNSDWSSSKEFHTILETIATLLAAIVGAIALIAYHSNKNTLFLFIGEAFLGVAFLDGFHAIVTSSSVSIYFSSSLSSLIPWSWLSSRLFLSIIFFLAWYISMKEIKSRQKSKIKENTIYIIVVTVAIVNFFLFAFMPLPRAYYPELFFGRPEELLPALFFLIALIGFLKQGKWKDGVFEHWVVIFLIINFFSEALYMSFSRELFDIQFDVAHLLKKITYLTMLVGLLIYMFRIFLKAESINVLLSQKNTSLKQEKDRTGQTIEKLELSKTRFEEKIQELENIKIATVNILEDLNIEKEKLEEAKAKDEAILSSIGNGLIVVDKNLKVILKNKAAEDILGLPHKSIFNKNWLEVVNVSDESGNRIDNADTPAVKALKTRETVIVSNFKLYYSKKDKSTFPVSITASPIIVGKKNIGVIIIFKDVSKEREIDRAKTEFVSLASHQLRTPLSIINWYSEMLLDGDAGELNEEQSKFVDAIYTGNHRMVELVNALLNVSRIELGTMEADPEPIDIAEVTASIIEEQRNTCEEKCITIYTKCPKDLPNLHADPKQLRMVLENLVSNSIKYTPDKGKINIDIRIVKEGETLGKRTIRADSILIKVADTGYGIPIDQQSQIFLKLFRADNIVKKDTEGSGLGLYIVKSIIDNTGGDIWVESKENDGTTFFVILPLQVYKDLEKNKKTLV